MGYILKTCLRAIVKDIPELFAQPARQIGPAVRGQLTTRPLLRIHPERQRTAAHRNKKQLRLRHSGGRRASFQRTVIDRQIVQNRPVTFQIDRPVAPEYPVVGSTGLAQGIEVVVFQHQPPKALPPRRPVTFLSVTREDGFRIGRILRVEPSCDQAVHIRIGSQVIGDSDRQFQHTLAITEDKQGTLDTPLLRIFLPVVAIRITNAAKIQMVPVGIAPRFDGAVSRRVIDAGLSPMAIAPVRSLIVQRVGRAREQQNY